MVFTLQMTNNLGGVDKIDTVSRMKTHLINVALIAKSCVRYDYKIGTENTLFLKEILGLLQEMKVSGRFILVHSQTIYKENIEMMQNRYEQVENSLSNFSAECFRNKSALNYYSIHEGK